MFTINDGYCADLVTKRVRVSVFGLFSIFCIIQVSKLNLGFLHIPVFSAGRWMVFVGFLSSPTLAID